MTITGFEDMNVAVGILVLLGAPFRAASAVRV